MDSTLVALISVGATLLVGFVVMLVLAGGQFERIPKALKILQSAPADQPTGPPKPSGAPLRILAVMQRDARLIDFLMEDIAGATNEQVGDFARKFQADAKKVLNRHLTLVPVRSETEGDTIEVPVGFDPSQVRLVGNVTGQPPFRGVLKHAGWRVTEMKLDAPPAGQDEFILMPAEVEL